MESDYGSLLSFANKFQVGEEAVRARGSPHLGRAAPLPVSEGQTLGERSGNVEL